MVLADIALVNQRNLLNLPTKKLSSITSNYLKLFGIFKKGGFLKGRGKKQFFLPTAILMTTSVIRSDNILRIEETWGNGAINQF